MARDRGAHGVGDAEAEEPGRRVGDLAERHDVAPDRLGGRLDLHARDHLAGRRCRSRSVDGRQPRQRQDDDDSVQRCPRRRERDVASDHGAGQDHRQRDGQGHRDADRAFDREQQDAGADEDDRHRRDAQRRRQRPRALAVEDERAAGADHERNAEEDRPAVAPEHQRGHRDQPETDRQRHAE